MYIQTNFLAMIIIIHDVILRCRKKERKKERHLRQWKNENESCLRWDSNPQHSVLQTDALPTELPTKAAQGLNQTSYMPV